MKHVVKSAEFRRMSPERQEEALKELVRAASSPPNGEVRDLDEQIRAFEEKLGLSSQDLRRELAQGQREESWEVCQWLMLLHQRDYLLGARSARSH